MRRFIRLLVIGAMAAAGAAFAVTLQPDPAAAQTTGLRFVRWRQAQGLFSADVPAGWRVEGRVAPEGLDKGAFLIEGYSPDGRAMFAFAHNWLYFMEYQYGRYRPGRETLETFVLPGIPQSWPAVRTVRVAYRSANTGSTQTSDAGLPMRLDAGTIGLLATSTRGEHLAGTITGQTLYLPMGATPGLWSLRIFAGGIAPATEREQQQIQAIQARLVASLELAPEFLAAWSRAHQQTTALMRQYSADMDRVFSRYLASAARSNSPGRDPAEAWAEMMREGHYEQDDRTGEQHWVGNEYGSWFKNEQGYIVGSNTGAPPADQHTWNPLRR